MMKFSKTLLVVLGVVASLAFVGLMLYVVIQVNQLHAVAIANRSAGFANPRNWMLIAAGLGFLAGYCSEWVWHCPTRPSRPATPNCAGPRTSLRGQEAAPRPHNPRPTSTPPTRALTRIHASADLEALVVLEFVQGLIRSRMRCSIRSSSPASRSADC